MIATILCAAALEPSAPLQFDVVTASLFKNGYAVVTREAQFPGSGTWTVDGFPQAVLGTFWITASKGVKLSEVVLTSEEYEVERDAASMDEILALNLGKRLTFTLSDRRQMIGTLKSVAGSVAILEEVSAEGKPLGIRALPKSYVTEVASPGGDLLWKLKQKASKRVLRFKADAPGKGSLILVGLERGLTWAPAYSVDISDPKKLRLVAKATILDDLADLKGIELRLVTGFPNVPYINIWDPFTSMQSVDQWVSALMQAGAPDAARPQPGFAGQMAANYRMAERGAFDEAFTVSHLPGQQSEDLFFYRQPDVRLKKGDRGYYVLFSAESDYSHIYEVDVPDQIQDTSYQPRPDMPNDVWHSLKFKNTSGRPFTTAAAVTMKDGEMLGQDMMRYTTAGADATCRITKALDVKVDDAEEEIDRQVQVKVVNSYYDHVTLKGTIQIANQKPSAVKLEVTKWLTGQVKSTEGNPKVTAHAKGLRAVNPRQKLQWTLDLKAGEKRELGYVYTVYINR